MKIGIIGLGNLGRSLLEGLILTGTSPSNIYVCDLAKHVNEIGERYKVNATWEINDTITQCDVVFFVVKSHIFKELAAKVEQPIDRTKTMVSFMAGVSFDEIHEAIGPCRLVRAMPSLAIATGEGIIGYTEAPAPVADIFHKLGYAFQCLPEEIEKVMAFTACGLGFAAYILDAYVSAGLSMGFSQEDAVEMTSRTFANAVSRGDFGATAKAVATAGGATEQGILHMKASDIEGIIKTAVTKAYDKMK